LQAQTSPFLVIEDSPKVSASLKDKAIEAITGNASDSEILEAANPSAARNLVIAIPNAFEAGRVTALARAANPEINIVVRACSKAEAQYLHDLGANSVILGEEEIAAAMAKAIGTEIKRKNADTVSEGAPQTGIMGIISDGTTDIMGKKGDDMKHEGVVTG